jgi:hypothetical protein
VRIGTGDTPTPLGRFYLGSLIKPLDPNDPYGDYAYGLSAYSDVISDWRWGGLVGLHGTDDAGSIGHDVSHGCIRMRDADITMLAQVLPLGTPIIIRWEIGEGLPLHNPHPGVVGKLGRGYPSNPYPGGEQLSLRRLCRGWAITGPPWS